MQDRVAAVTGGASEIGEALLSGGAAGHGRRRVGTDRDELVVKCAALRGSPYLAHSATAKGGVIGAGLGVHQLRVELRRHPT